MSTEVTTHHQQEHPHHHLMNVDPRVHRMEMLISHTLRWGVMLSFLVILVGMVVTFTQHTDYFSSGDRMQVGQMEKAKFPITLGEVATGLARGRGEAIVVAGLLLLILTPVLRVAISIPAFAFDHDKVFVIITSIVLILLLVSFFLGKVE